jgi:hypothetical protein
MDDRQDLADDAHSPLELKAVARDDGFLAASDLTRS